MIEQVEKEIQTRFAKEVQAGKLKLSVAYTYVTDKAMEFKTEIENTFKKYNLEIEYVDPLSLSVSCHIGDGAIAMACYVTY